MTAIALVTLKYNVKIYIFVLMHNHIHILLSATGTICVEVFDYLKQRINKQLKEDHYPPLPEDYDFKLTPILDRKSFQDHFIYIARNIYEKGLFMPGGYLWGSDYLLFSQWADHIKGRRVNEMSQREVTRLTRSAMKLPEQWEIHPELGILPKCFISTEKARELFPSVKSYLTRLVKDFEAFVHISDSLGEANSLDVEEIKELVGQLLTRYFTNRSLDELTADEKSRLAVIMHDQYRLEPQHIARALYLPNRIVHQVLHSKDYSHRRR